MASPVTVAIGLTLALGIIDYLSEGFLARRAGAFKERFVSFVAGLSASYIFLHLFPLVYSGAEAYPALVFPAMLLGFVVYHLIEKWIYQHAPRDKIIEEVEEEHAITLFFYHLVIGFILVSLLDRSITTGLLYFIPVSLHVVINVLPHSHRFRRRQVKAFFAAAPLLGVLSAAALRIPAVVDFALLGILAGLLLFLEAREVIPRKRKGSMLFFVLGVVLYGALIAWTGM